MEDGWGERTHLTQKTPVFDAEGQPVAVIGLSTDISEHKRAEEALRRSEAQLAEAQQIAGVGSWHWDPDAHEITWSAELMRILGIAPGAETVGDDTMELVHPDDRDRVAAESRAAMDSGGTMELEFRMLHADGDYRLLLCRGGATMGPGGTVRRFDGVCEDVTERRHAEQRLAEAQRLGPDRVLRPRPRPRDRDVVAGDVPHLRRRARRPRPVAGGRAQHGGRAGPRAAAGRGRPRDRRGRRVRLLRDDPPRETVSSATSGSAAPYTARAAVRAT